jgi:hypothetical protein
MRMDKSGTKLFRNKEKNKQSLNKEATRIIRARMITTNNYRYCIFKKRANLVKDSNINYHLNDKFKTNKMKEDRLYE